MALPNSRRRIPTPRPVVSNRPDSLVETKRNRILTAILDSMIDNPDQTTSERVQATEKMASRFKERKFAIAGVRANLTRGAYGDVNGLLAQRRRERKQALKAAKSR